MKSDILNMKDGEKMDVLLLDPHIFINISLDLPFYHKYKPDVFFRENKAVFTKGKGLSGTFLFINYNLTKKLELFVEYKKNFFHQVTNGKVYTKNAEDIDESFDFENGNYRVGWKGPMIAWKNINELPIIYLMDINHYNKQQKEIVDKI